MTAGWNRTVGEALPAFCNSTSSNQRKAGLGVDPVSINRAWIYPSSAWISSCLQSCCWVPPTLRSETLLGANCDVHSLGPKCVSCFFPTLQIEASVIAKMPENVPRSGCILNRSLPPKDPVQWLVELQEPAFFPIAGSQVSERSNPLETRQELRETQTWNR